MSCCWLAQFSDVPCSGRLVKAHLIPAQRIRREIIADRLVPCAREDPVPAAIIWDERVWVPACGGLTGLSGHHGMLDSKQLTVPRTALPDGLEAFAEEFGLGWSLDRDFGLREAVS